jgi:hypothetical protein
MESIFGKRFFFEKNISPILGPFSTSLMDAMFFHFFEVSSNVFTKLKSFSVIFGSSKSL